MNRITGLFISICFLLALSADAQQSRCGTNQWLQQYRHDRPAKAANMMSTIDQIYQSDRYNTRRLNEVITIPVVVHVVYHTNDENISDEQVRSQIAVLNEDFRRLNADTFRTSTVFKPIAADARIEFRLAVRDPNGNATTGITRTATSTPSFSSSVNVKLDSTGGKGGWPADQYLNVWVCNLVEGSTFGYATMPGSEPSQDGVVIKYTAFGRTGDVEYPYQLGRTTTHEVGHWLGLFHPFDGGCAGTNASTCDTEGDRICDTPPAAYPNFTCGQADNTCTETPTDLPDQSENFMDYSDDACLNMFTQGQVAVMRATLNGARASLKLSPALTPVHHTDVGTDQVTIPDDQSCQVTFTPEIVLTNYGLDKLTTASIHYQVDNGNIGTVVWTGNLDSLASAVVSLQEVTIAPGNHSITIFVSNPNNTTDGFNVNDTIVKDFTIASPVAQLLPFSEDFEGIIFPPLEWETVNLDAGLTWALGNNITGSDDMNGRAAYIHYYIYDVMGEKDALVSPTIDLTNASQPVLNFDVAFAKKTNSNLLHYGKLEVLVSTDCDHFDPVTTIAANDLATISSPESMDWKPQETGEWQRQTLDLSAYNGEQVKIMFRSQNGLGNNLYIDNVQVRESASTGLDEPDALKNFSIYPNPSEDGLYYLRSSTDELKTIEVLNYTGKRIIQIEQVADHNVIINLQEQQPGFYLIKVNTASVSQTYKVIKL